MHVGSTAVCRCAVFVSLLFGGTVAVGDEEAAAGRGAEEHGARVARIAVCQIFCIDGDPEGNLRRIEYAVEDAAAQKADLACFPESAILGWVNPEAHELADPIPGPTTQRLGELARRHHLMICVGMDETDGESLYDAAVLIGADGTLLLKQRKVDNLARLKLMDPPYADGRPEDARVVDTPLGRIGIAICADSYNEARVRGIGRFSPDLLLAPFAWAAEPTRWPEYGQVIARLVGRAAEWARCPVVGVDGVGMITHGPWAGRIYGGQSAVADREGRVLAVLRDRDAEVRVLEVSIGDRADDE
jgi:N-carbamoylputrescine amidase